MTPFLLATALLLVYSTIVQCGDDGRCLSTDNGWFYISDDKLDHDKAADYCRKLRGQLAVLDSKEKSDAVVKLIKQRDGGAGNKRRYIIGAKQKLALTERRFYWDDNHHIELKSDCSYVNWCKGHPESIFKRCVAIENNDGGYCWNSTDCGNKENYVCERV